jgi:hypothetical protein
MKSEKLKMLKGNELLFDKDCIGLGGIASNWFFENVGVVQKLTFMGPGIKVSLPTLNSLTFYTQKNVLILTHITIVDSNLDLAARCEVAQLVKASVNLVSLTIVKVKFMAYETKPLLAAITLHPCLKYFVMLLSNCCPHIVPELRRLISQNRVLKHLFFDLDVHGSHHQENTKFIQWEMEQLKEAMEENWCLTAANVNGEKFSKTIKRNKQQFLWASRSIVAFMIVGKKHLHLGKDVCTIIGKLLIRTCHENGLWYRPNILHKLLALFK